MAFEFNQIAADHNNLAGLTRWSKLGTTACPLFQGYKRFIPMEWNAYESAELGGDRLYKKIGLPNAAFVFPRISEEEHNYIVENFTVDGISGYVTVTLYDREYLTWKNFNGTLVIQSDNRNYSVEAGEYTDYRLEFYDLEEI